MNNDLISREALKETIDKDAEDICGIEDVIDYIDNAPTVKFSLLPADESKDEAYMRGYEKGLAVGLLKARLQGECRTCKHRDPEDKKCDCGGLERQGCPFPVSDDCFCKFYEGSKVGYNNGYVPAQKPTLCEECDYYMYAHKLIDNIVELMVKYNVADLDELKAKLIGGQK